MKPISCDRCGVVLDANKLNFPTDTRSEDLSIDRSKAAWNGDIGDYEAFVACPVCGEPVFESKAQIG